MYEEKQTMEISNLSPREAEFAGYGLRAAYLCSIIAAGLCVAAALFV